MATDIDSLRIKIQGTAQGANKSINQLIKNLNTLQGALKSIDTSKLNTFSSGMSKASANGTKFATSLNKVNVSAKSTSKSVDSLASAFGKFYASYFLVVRGVKSFAKSIKSTADYIESFNYYTVAFGKVASEWDKDWKKYGSENARNYSNAFVQTMNETLGKLSGMEVAIGSDGKGLISSTGTQNLGLNIQEVTQYASQLASVTNSLGQTGKTTLAISQSFTQLAGDISSLFNVDYSTVANNLQSALIGQSRSVYKYGIDITNATLQTYAYKLGLEKAVSEMTQMEKQQLRVLAILDQSKVSFGDLANTINSPSNQMRQLTNNLEQCGVVLGQLFMPIVESVLPVVNGLTIALRQLLVDIAGFFNIKIDFSKFGQGFNQSEEDLEGFGDELDEISEKAKKTQNRLQGFDKLNVISSNKNSGTSTQGNQSTIDLTQQIVSATQKYQSEWDKAYKNMENRAQQVAKNIKKFFKPIEQPVSIVADFTSDVFFALYDNFFKPMGEWALSEGVPKFFEIINDFVDSVDWETVTDFLENTLSLASDVLIEISDTMLNIAGKVAPKIAPILQKFVELGNTLYKEILQPLWSFIKKNILPVIEGGLTLSLTTALSGVDSFVSGITSALGGMIKIVSGIFTFDLPKVFSGITDVLGGVKEATIGTISSMVENIAEFFLPEEWNFNGVAEGLGKAFNAAISSVKKIWNTFANFLNSKLTWTIDPLVIFGKTLFKGTTISLGKIPTFATYQTGGFPEDGFFFANHNELVGKFSNGQTAVANNEQIVAGIKQGVKEAVSEILAPYLSDIADSSRKTANKNFGITSREVFNATRAEANNYSMRTGKPAFS